MKLMGTRFLAIVLAACASGPVGVSSAESARIVFPAMASQGQLVFGKVPAGSDVQVDGRALRTTPYGTAVFGIGRDRTDPVNVTVRRPDGSEETVPISVTPRDWPVERVAGIPPQTVNPPPTVAERIAREQAMVSSARLRDEPRVDFTQGFIWPVNGRISGRFGNQRVYVLPDGTGEPKSPHSGMDIAAAAGTPVRAPAAGVVTFANPDLYLTGGTVLLDHGHGVSSNFLHLSRIDVQVGAQVRQGDIIGAVGSTGRSSGPHLHWGMNWFEVRIDPLLVLERTGANAGSAEVAAGP